MELSNAMHPVVRDMSGSDVGFSASPSHHPENDESAERWNIGSHPHVEGSSWPLRIRATCLTLLGATAVFVVIDAKTTKYVETFFAIFTDWLSTHPESGIVAVIVLYVVATVLFVPGSILTIGTGFAFHHAFSQSIILAVLLSSMAVFIGACLGSIACFLLGRFLFRDIVLQMASQYPLFMAMDRGT
jgi:uncharacterized membrane protein YdjX (TVP38/TMEM64 family)